MNPERLLREYDLAGKKVQDLDAALKRAREEWEGLRKQVKSLVAAGGKGEAQSGAEPAPEKVPFNLRAVSDLLNGHLTRTFGVDEVAHDLNLDKPIARNRLQRAAREGLILRVERGRYAGIPRQLESASQDEPPEPNVEAS